MLTINAIVWKATHIGNYTDRPHGTGDYVFVLYRDPTVVRLKGVEYTARPGACLLCDRTSPHFHHSLGRVRWSNDFIHFDGEDLTPLSQKLGLPFDTRFIRKTARIFPT